MEFGSLGSFGSVGSQGFGDDIGHRGEEGFFRVVPEVRADESQPAVYESLTCIEFADDLAEKSKRAGPRPLLPEDPVLRARARIWASWADKNISVSTLTVALCSLLPAPGFASVDLCVGICRLHSSALDQVPTSTPYWCRPTSRGEERATRSW